VQTQLGGGDRHGGATAMNGAYLATAGRIRQELAELDQVVARIENIWTRRRQEPLPAEKD